jgi:hypothetical protein
MSIGLQKVRAWFRRAANAVEDVAEGETAVATPPPGSTAETDRETSTNAQTQGAAGQPWSDDH